LIAVGAVVRVGIGNLALSTPVPLYGVLAKVGLSETLAFVSGFVFGPAIGFGTGVLIITLSDMATIPGAWTPFIASIIGLIGLCAGIMARLTRKPSIMTVVLLAAILTLMSEFLQNAWVSLFYNVPIVAAMISGLPSLAMAEINNITLFPTVGLRIIKMLQEPDLPH